MVEKTLPTEPLKSPEFSSKNIPLALQARLVQGAEALKPTNTNLPDVTAETLVEQWKNSQSATLQKLSLAAHSPRKYPTVHI